MIFLFFGTIFIPSVFWSSHILVCFYLEAHVTQTHKFMRFGGPAALAGRGTADTAADATTAAAGATSGACTLIANWSNVALITAL